MKRIPAALTLLTIVYAACTTAPTGIPALPGATTASLRVPSGDYTLTVVARSTCTGMPADLRSRTDTATVTTDRVAHSSVAVFGTYLMPFTFGLNVTGDKIDLTIDGPEFFERLPALTYLEISGSTSADAPATSTGGTILIPFSGSFAYCVLKAELGSDRNCYDTAQEQKIAFAQCGTDHMLLTPR